MSKPPANDDHTPEDVDREPDLKIRSGRDALVVGLAAAAGCLILAVVALAGAVLILAAAVAQH